jgi:hypothetical protein
MVLRPATQEASKRGAQPLAPQTVRQAQGVATAQYLSVLTKVAWRVASDRRDSARVQHLTLVLQPVQERVAGRRSSSP